MSDTEFNAEIDIHSLILICVDSVISNNDDCTFERLVFECFTNYPKVFGFFKYPDWPDSNKLDRPLRKLRERGLIVGSPKMGFLLTDHGKHLALRARKMLKQQIKPQPTPHILKGKERNFVAYIKSSELYQRFLYNRTDFNLTGQEFIDFLRATLETPKRVLRQNLAQYKKLTTESGDIELQEFLTICEEKTRSLFV